MMRIPITYRSILSVAFCFAASLLQAQDDIVLKAMQDELNRSMTELQLPGYEKPFFILYRIEEQTTHTIAATLGSVTESSETPFRSNGSTRVLVGDYGFNDESLEDNLLSSPTAREIQLPVDNDYFGIRRSLWSTTDKVYRDAARIFQKHTQTLKESPKKLEELPHRSFAKSEPVKMITSLAPYSFNKSEWESKARILSLAFLKHAFIENSFVMVQYHHGHRYLVTSEGTIAKIPFQQASILAICQTKTSEGEFGMDRVFHIAGSPDQLPDEATLTREIEAMIGRQEILAKTQKFEEEYSGPVLIVGDAVAEIFSNTLLQGREGIYASDHIRKLTGYQYDDDMISMDGKIGKPVINEAITLRARPKLKTYGNTPLLGSFDLDTEGIVPQDELIIVEKGILKNLLNNRTITHPTQSSNGFDDGPGVLEVSVSYKDTEKQLKDKLIAKAKSEGLDFAYIIRETSSMGMDLRNVYKVSVSDGSEVLVKNTLVETNGFKTFKRILGASGVYRACNIGGETSGRNNNHGIISFIVPDAILLEEMDLKPFPMPTLKEDQYVSSPLGW